MIDYTIEEFCEKHSACSYGRSWAMENCTDMQDAWDKLPPDFFVWAATRPGVLSDKELRLFAVFCARQVQHMMTNPRSIAAIDVAEKYAHGEASIDELLMERDAAVVAWDAAWGAAWSARDAMDAAWGAARDAAMDAARHAQAKWLRENTKPNFGGV